MNSLGRLIVSVNRSCHFRIPVFYEKKFVEHGVLSASVRGACILGTHTATYSINGSAHACKLFLIKYGT